MSKMCVIAPWLLNAIMNYILNKRSANIYNRRVCILSTTVVIISFISLIISFFINSLINELLPGTSSIIAAIYSIKLANDYLNMQKTLNDLNKK